MARWYDDEELTMSAPKGSGGPAGRPNFGTMAFVENLWREYTLGLDAELLTGNFNEVKLNLPERLRGRATLPGRPDDLKRVTFTLFRLQKEEKVHLRARIEPVPFLSRCYLRELRMTRGWGKTRFVSEVSELLTDMGEHLQRLALLRELQHEIEKRRADPGFEAALEAEHERVSPCGNSLLYHHLSAETIRYYLAWVKYRTPGKG